MREALVGLMMVEAEGVLSRSESVVAKVDSLEISIPAAINAATLSLNVSVMDATEALQSEVGHLLTAQAASRRLAQDSMSAIASQIEETVRTSKLLASEAISAEADGMALLLRKATAKLIDDFAEASRKETAKLVEAAISGKVAEAMKTISDAAIKIDIRANKALDDLELSAVKVSASAKDIMISTFGAVFLATTLALTGFWLVLQYSPT